MKSEEVGTLSPTETLLLLKHYYNSEEYSVVDVVPTAIYYIDEEHHGYYTFGFEVKREKGQEPLMVEVSRATAIVKEVYKKLLNEADYDNYELQFSWAPVITSNVSSRVEFKGCRMARTLKEMQIAIPKKSRI